MYCAGKFDGCVCGGEGIIVTNTTLGVVITQIRRIFFFKGIFSPAAFHLDTSFPLKYLYPNQPTVTELHDYLLKQTVTSSHRNYTFSNPKDSPHFWEVNYDSQNCIYQFIMHHCSITSVSGSSEQHQSFCALYTDLVLLGCECVSSLCVKGYEMA